MHAHAAGSQIQEVIVIAAHRPRLKAVAIVLQRAQRRPALGQELSLDLPCKVQVVGGLDELLNAFSNVFAQRGQQPIVVPGLQDEVTPRPCG